MSRRRGVHLKVGQSLLKSRCCVHDEPRTGSSHDAGWILATASSASGRDSIGQPQFRISLLLLLLADTTYLRTQHDSSRSPRRSHYSHAGRFQVWARLKRVITREFELRKHFPPRDSPRVHAASVSSCLSNREQEIVTL